MVVNISWIFPIEITNFVSFLTFSFNSSTWNSMVLTPAANGFLRKRMRAFHVMYSNFALKVDHPPPLGETKLLTVLTLMFLRCKNRSIRLFNSSKCRKSLVPLVGLSLLSLCVYEVYFVARSTILEPEPSMNKSIE